MSMPHQIPNFSKRSKKFKNFGVTKIIEADKSFRKILLNDYLSVMILDIRFWTLDSNRSKVILCEANYQSEVVTFVRTKIES